MDVTDNDKPRDKTSTSAVAGLSWAISTDNHDVPNVDYDF